MSSLGYLLRPQPDGFVPGVVQMMHSLGYYTATRGPTRLVCLWSPYLPVSLLSWPAAFGNQAGGHYGGLSELWRGIFRERQQQSDQDTEPPMTECSLSSNPFYLCPTPRPSQKSRGGAYGSSRDVMLCYDACRDRTAVNRALSTSTGPSACRWSDASYLPGLIFWTMISSILAQ